MILVQWGSELQVNEGVFVCVCKWDGEKERERERDAKDRNIESDEERNLGDTKTETDITW